MSRQLIRCMSVGVATLLLGACAGDGANVFQTASVSPPPVKVDAATTRTSRVDPACVTLASQIEGLRKDGSIDRLEKVATGKGAAVQVKRTTVAKQAELNKANAEFQFKCGPRISASQQAAATPATSSAAAATVAAAPTAAAKTTAKAAATAPSGVTVAPSAAAIKQPVKQ